MAVVATLALAGGLAIAAGAPASAAGCVRGDGDVFSSNYAYTLDANGMCGTLGANTYYSPMPGIEAYSGWVYSSTNYVESRHIATMIYGYHSGS
ncbi:MAG TPA: hypothetical protein VIH37_03640 [Candidatus Limnocylindrales bacterium]